RISSVLKIVTKEGDNTKWHGGGGIGLLTSYLSLGGPLKKDKSTLYLSFRSTYSDWLLRTANSEYGNLKNYSASFLYWNFKFPDKIFRKDKLIVSAYTSYDRFRLTNDSTYSWRIIAGSVRHDHSFNSKLFSSL